MESERRIVVGREQEGRKKREGTGKRKKTRKGEEGGQMAGRGSCGNARYTGTDKWRKKPCILEHYEPPGVLHLMMSRQGPG